MIKCFLQGLILLMESQAVDDTVVTPSSKRKESNKSESDISSTIKKLCTSICEERKDQQKGVKHEKSG